MLPEFGLREIEKAGAILEQKNIDIRTLEGLEEELRANGLIVKDALTLVSVLKKVKKMRYDPKEIALEIS